MNFSALSALSGFAASSRPSASQEKHPFLGFAMKAGGALCLGFLGWKAGEFVSNNTVNKPNARYNGDVNFFASEPMQANEGRDVFDFLSVLSGFFSLLGRSGASSQQNMFNT